MGNICRINGARQNKWGQAPFCKKENILIQKMGPGPILGQNLSIEFFGEIEYIRKLKDSHCLKILTETRFVISGNFVKIFVLKG